MLPSVGDRDHHSDIASSLHLCGTHRQTGVGERGIRQTIAERVQRTTTIVSVRVTLHTVVGDRRHLEKMNENNE